METTLQDIAYICRICLQSGQSSVGHEVGPIVIRQLSSIHNSIAVNSEFIFLIDMITMCVSKELSEDKSFPQMICNHCVQRLIDFYELRVQIEQSEQFLLNLLSHRLYVNLNDVNHHIAEVDIGYNFKSQMNTISTPMTIEITTVNKDVSKNAGAECATNSPKQHLISNSCKSILKCLICSKRFTSSLTLNRHLITHHTVRNDLNIYKPHQCNECSKSYTTLANLVLHKAIHTGIKSFICEICQRGFYKKTSLASHMSIHTGIRKHLCTICNRRFTSANILQQHKRTHSDVRRFSCSVCSKGFHTSNDLRVHFRSHSGEKPYLCSHCGRGFSRVTHLNIHLRTHSGEKPYCCTQCPKAFAQSGDLKAHVRIHSGEKPYSCTFCEKRFNQTSGLASHMKSHTGERNYVCFCGKSFTQSSSLARHGKLHRRNEAVTEASTEN